MHASPTSRKALRALNIVKKNVSRSANARKKNVWKPRLKARC